MKTFEVEHLGKMQTLRITLHHPPYEDEDILNKTGWKAKDVVIKEMKTMKFEEETNDSIEG